MTKNELIVRNREICDALSEMNSRELNDEEKKNFDALTREYENNSRQITLLNQQEEAQRLNKTTVKDANTALRELTKKVANREIAGHDLALRADSQNVITSAQIGTDKNNMESAGIPQIIEDLLNPLEMATIYDKVGLKVYNNVRGKIVWPHLDTIAEATVNGELESVGEITLDFSKITPQVFTVGAVAKVDNESVNDAGFDLISVVTAQLNKSVSRTLNKRTLALSAPTTQPAFVGPLKAIATAASSPQKVTFAAATPTYKELKKLKGVVLKSAANMTGFCYIMDAAMYSELEATSKDAGSGRFIIENGMIDGSPIFITDLAEYSGVVAAGVFSYEALTQHGAWFTIDPFTMADKGVVRYVIRANYSLTNLEATPFAVGKKWS